MYESMRFTAAAGKDVSPLSDVIARSFEQFGGDLSIANLRQPGFRLLEQMVEKEGIVFRSAAVTPLPERAQVVLDKAVTSVGRARLSFVDDLISDGLTFNLPDPLSVTQLEAYSQGRTGNAVRVMNPAARVENVMPKMSPGRIPIYCTIARFELDIRTLKMSQRIGMPLDTNLIEQQTRAVNEAIEDAAVNGATTLDGQALVDAGYSAPGLLNAPNANTLNITDAAWTTAPVGTTILAETQAAADKLIADKYFGPYNLYVGTVIGNVFNGDFSTLKGDGTIRTRLEQLVYGGRNLRVRVTDAMPAGTAVLVQMTSNVMDMVVGQAPTVIPYTSLDGMIIHNLILAIMVQRVRSDYDGNSGIVIMT